MGIDYVIYLPDDTTHYCKDDWIYINSIKEIFELLDIRMYILYDNRINYWSPDQVKDMYEAIRQFYIDPRSLYEGWKDSELEKDMLETIKRAKELHTDAGKLTSCFAKYVEWGLPIHVI